MSSRMVERAVLNAARQKRAELEWLADCKCARSDIEVAGIRAELERRLKELRS